MFYLDPWAANEVLCTCKYNHTTVHTKKFLKPSTAFLAFCVQFGLFLVLAQHERWLAKQPQPVLSQGNDGRNRITLGSVLENKLVHAEGCDTHVASLAPNRVDGSRLLEVQSRNLIEKTANNLSRDAGDY